MISLMSESDSIFPSGENPLDIVSPQTQDSLGTYRWKEYLDPVRLHSAWDPPEHSPYASFVKTRLVDTLPTLSRYILPRYSKHEQLCKETISRLSKKNNLDSHTAVILDSGGAHSVAMAVQLMQEGYQPIIMLNGIPVPDESHACEQSVAVMLYYAQAAENLKASGKIRPDSSPAFILDAHRSDPPILPTVDNSYHLSSSDFPSPDILKKHGIQKVIYLNESDKKGQLFPLPPEPIGIHQDLIPMLYEWQNAGLQVVHTGIKPSPGTNNISKDVNSYTRWEEITDSLIDEKINTTISNDIHDNLSKLKNFYPKKLK
jgi:hypothetical protein